MNIRLVTSALIVSLGGLVFGYDLGALSSASQSLRSAFTLLPSAFGLTISASLWGTVCGSLLAGWIADRIERRILIMACAVVYAVAALTTFAQVPSEWILVLAIRFTCGLAIGGFTVGCPLYLSELAPISHRGRFVSLFQIQIGAGVVIAFFVGLLVTKGVVTKDAWKWCLGTGAIPAIVLVGLLMLLPAEKPEFRTGMSKSLSAAGGHFGRDKLFRRGNTRALLLATSIAVFNQLSGVNVLLLYMLDILAGAGIGRSLGHTYTVVISCVSLLITMIAMTAVDIWGRKPLLLVGSTGMAVCLFYLALSAPRHFAPGVYLSILIAYNVFFAFSQGILVWVYLSELFPPGIRGAGQGYGSSVHWIANAILISVFPAMQHALSDRAFYVFAVVMVVQIAVVWLWYPETRRTSLGSSL